MNNNYSLTVVVTVKNDRGTTTSTVPTQVRHLLYPTWTNKYEPTWTVVSVGADEGVEKQQLRGGSPDYTGRHGESVRAAGSAHRWGSRTDLHLGFWYAKHWGEPGSAGRKDGGNAVMFGRSPRGSGALKWWRPLTFQLREQMLTKISTVLLDSPSNTTNQVEVTARAVAGLTQRPDELSLAAQVLQK